MSLHPEKLSFWEHLDALRSALLKTGLAILLFGSVAFIFKDELFAILLAPKDARFITYRILEQLPVPLPQTVAESWSVQLINTGLAGQFMIHLKTAMCAGFLCASPYILYQLFRFVSPALYADERKYAVKVASGGYVMFLLGVLLSYYVIFPFTFRFLGTYTVAEDVGNMILLQSYMGTLLTMSLSLGIVFELPVVCWLFGKLGFITYGFMRKYRKHAIVAILTTAALITPTSDIFTLLLVSLPMLLLYEVSIILLHPRRKTAVFHPA